jgi:hypothetical protein
MWEIAYTLGKDLLSFILSFFHKRKRKLTKSEIVQLRQKWKSEFEKKILELRISEVYTDVIIRDVKRMDSYPNDDKKKGISSWFRVSLLDTYHRGIQVLLRIGKLTKDRESGKWRYTDYKSGESGDLRVFLVGFIPFENIEAVDLDGDEHYYLPNIYCHFVEKSGEPYEKIAFCEEKFLDERPYFTEVIDFKSVHKFSKKFKVDYFA